MRWPTLLLMSISLGGVVVYFSDELLPIAQLLSIGTPASAEPVCAPEVVPERKIYASGFVEGVQRDVALRFEVTGRVSVVHVREGDKVAKGGVLAEIDSQSWKARVAEAEARLQLARAERVRLANGARKESRAVLKADVRTAEVQVHEAEALLARGKLLAQRHSISAQELDDYRFKNDKAIANLQATLARLAEIDAPAREDELSIADARIALAEANVRHERALLDKTLLRAPSDGIVLHVLVESGELVSPEHDRALITMTDREGTRVRAFVEELDALSVSSGQVAVITVDGKPDERFLGAVLSCSPFVQGKRHRTQKPGERIDVQVREIVIELEAASELIVGLPVDVLIERGAAEKSLPPARGMVPTCVEGDSGNSPSI